MSSEKKVHIAFVILAMLSTGMTMNPANSFQEVLGYGAAACVSFFLSYATSHRVRGRKAYG